MPGLRESHYCICDLSFKINKLAHAEVNINYLYCCREDFIMRVLWVMRCEDEVASNQCAAIFSEVVISILWDAHTRICQRIKI
jgi:hypothetical protein